MTVLRSDGSLQPVVGWNAGRFIIPASNNKLPTTATAFLAFGPSKTFDTQVVSDGYSLICVRGAGVPLLHSDLAAFAVAHPELSGGRYSVVVDGTLFGPQSVPGGWEWGDLAYDYGAYPVASVLAQGTVSFVVAPGAQPGDLAQVSLQTPQDQGALYYTNEIVTGTVTSVDYIYYAEDPFTLHLVGTIAANETPFVVDPAVHQPSLRFGIVLANYLNLSLQRVSVGACPSNATTIVGVIPSAPLRTIMNHTLQESDNLEAELYMRHLGVAAGGPDNYQAGLAAVKLHMASLGVAEEFVQTDGSGLGRSNLLTPNGLVQLLRAMLKTEWVDYLPVGGESGTLSDRFLGTGGRVKAKTGSMTGVNSLSGYVFPAGFRDVVLFSIINNGNSDIDYTIMHNATDSIVYEMLKCQN